MSIMPSHSHADNSSKEIFVEEVSADRNIEGMARWLKSTSQRDPTVFGIVRGRIRTNS